jgi:hypothetical protein
MKYSKWLKWKIGFVGALGLTILFHEVKVSPAFDIASANASKGTPIDTSSQTDAVMNEFNSSNQQPIQGSQSSQSDTSNRQSHTKTGRS